jgi:CCR4-NOT transcription complex subunit 6
LLTHVFFRFNLLDEHLIEFNQLAMSYVDGTRPGSEAMLNRVMIRDNIGVAVLLELNESASARYPSRPQHLLVTNTHIHWDPEYCDVKLIQAIMFLNQLESIMLSAQSERGIGVKTNSQGVPGIPVVICGDFNSLPDSGVVEYFTRGRISTDHSDFLRFNYDRFFEATILSTSTVMSPTGTPELKHPINIKSCYSPEHMTYTNYTYHFKGIIDYIFCSSDFLQPLCVLGGVSNEWLKTCKVIGCPNPHFPSDHFPLMCELELLFQE